MTKMTREYLEKLLAPTSATSEDIKRLSEASLGLSHLLQLDEYSLTLMSGCKSETADFIRLVAALTSRRITDKFKFGKKYLQNEIEEYIFGLFFGASVETIYILLFDEDDRLISCDCLGDGTVNSSGFLPRKMVDIALRKNAASVIIAHNHPLGKTEPSNNDISTTSLVKSVLSSAHITLLAHYIVSGTDIYDCLPEIFEKTEQNHSFKANNKI